MKLNIGAGCDIDILRANNPRLRFKLRRGYCEITPKMACPDCGEPMADGSACGYYCTAKGCYHDRFPVAATKRMREVKRG